MRDEHARPSEPAWRKRQGKSNAPRWLMLQRSRQQFGLPHPLIPINRESSAHGASSPSSAVKATTSSSANKDLGRGGETTVGVCLFGAKACRRATHEAQSALGRLADGERWQPPRSPALSVRHCSQSFELGRWQAAGKPCPDTVWGQEWYRCCTVLLTSFSTRVLCRPTVL